jgi:transcriptional regulator with AAA-type ATPase domain
MTPKKKNSDVSLTKLLGVSGHPVYAVDSDRRIAYCNAALENWFGLDAARIIGRQVEYHSEPEAGASSAASETSPLAALCPPPHALAGERCSGTISCVARDGRLVHRHAEFFPLGGVDAETEQCSTGKRPVRPARGGVLVLLAGTNLTTHDLAKEISRESTADELHRAIRRFRRAQATQYSLPSLLGDSSAMHKARAQVSAAAGSGANVLIVGSPGSGRAHAARAIHYRTAADAGVKLVPLDCRVATDDLWRRTMDSLQVSLGDVRQRPTLLLENLEFLAAPHQSQIVAAVRQNAVSARLIATLDVKFTLCLRADDVNVAKQASATASSATEIEHVPATPDTALLDTISTIIISLPHLDERPEDIPVLAQCFLEACNRGNPKQVGAVRPEALDLLALYSWPGELDELREVIAAAHRTTLTSEITPRDLPILIHHALAAATRIRRRPERIVLGQLLESFEKEVIERALTQAGGNKTEAAELLGMTRPRLYRRLIQLGLVAETFSDQAPQQPEFVETDSLEPES